MIQLQGFAPDADPTTPGVIVDCDNLIPYEAGMQASPSAVDATFDALADVCIGAGVTRDLSGTTKLFAGTDTDIYEASGTTWTSVGSGYTVGSDDIWKFAVFGNTPLAACKSEKIQRYSGGAFADIAAAPKAAFIVSAKGFVMALNTDDATYSDSPDRWWCSALLDETDWTPSITTQSATGRLTEGSGPITAAIRMGDSVVAYKERCIFVGTYVGGDAVWAWTPPIGDAGCVGGEAAVDTPVGNVFVGYDNVYIFDGTRPLPIATEKVRQWWMTDSDPAYRYKTKLLWDRENSRVWMFYPRAGDSGVCSGVLVYHVLTKQWGKLTQTVESVLTYASPGMTYEGLTMYTYDTLPDVSYDSPSWVNSKSSPAFFGTDHKVYSFTGAPGESYFVTNDFGEEGSYSMCDALMVRFGVLPSTSSCLGYTKETSGSTAVAGNSASFDGAKYPMRQTSRFHSFKVTMNGSAKVSGVLPKTRFAGAR